MKLFRIQSRFGESLWYDLDGKFTDKIKNITGQSIPMPWEDMRQSDPKMKLLSSVEDINMFPYWFNKDQIIKMFNSGYSLFEYDVDKCMYLSNGETLFDLNTINSSIEIQDEIKKVFNIYE